MVSDTLKLVHKLYRDYSRSVSEFRLDHHWVRVSQGRWVPQLRVIRLPDLSKAMQEEATRGMQEGQQTNAALWFLGQHPVCFIYPMSFMGVPLGYALREVGEKNFTVFQMSGVACYTASRANAELGSFRYHLPVVLVEGYADAEAVSQVYPFVVAMMTSSVKSVLAPLLPLLTSQVVLMFDNDKPGQAGQARGARMLRGKVVVREIPLPDGVKDPADWFVGDEAGFRRRLSTVLGV